MTTAKLLEQKGVEVNVYEREADPKTRISGGTLDIHKDTGQKALEKAGLLAVFYENSRPTGERITDSSASILNEEIPEGQKKFDRPEIDRSDLRRILLDSLNENTVVWYSQLISVDENKYILHFKNGKSVGADLLIVANGGGSNVRKYVTDIAPEYTGTYIIQGEAANPEISCPQYKKLCGKENLILIADEKMLYSQVKGTGALNYFLSFKAPKNWATTQCLDFKNKYAGLTSNQISEELVQ